MGPKRPTDRVVAVEVLAPARNERVSVAVKIITSVVPVVAAEQVDAVEKVVLVDKAVDLHLRFSMFALAHVRRFL